MSVVLLAISIGSYFYFTQKNSSQNSNELIIGIAAGYAPWVSINPQGEYEGFDIDFTRALAERMGKKLVLKDLGCMTSLFTALEQGKVDGIVWGMSITKDRLKKFAMVNYQGELVTSYPLMFWKTIPVGITSIVDMNGKTVCIEPTSSQESVLRKYDRISQLPTEKVDDALLNIQYGKADAALVEPAIAQKFKNKFPEIQILDVRLDDADQVAGVGVVIQKDNSGMINQIAQAVAALKATGVIAQFEQKWNMVP